MKKNWLFLLVLCLGCTYLTSAQGLHFSQYNNAPLLLSPANAGLMPNDNYRVGVQYRTQWSQVPVPYNTLSAYGDFQLLHNQGQTSWLGLGAAFFSDRAGAGDLSLTKINLDVAYHLSMGDYSMLSGGIGIAYAQRSVDFSKLSFDAQWDGYTFNDDLPNQEAYTVQKTAYPDISVGLNYAFFPGDEAYFKIGLGVLHVNQPKESFYGMYNKLGMRPMANLDMIFRLDERWIAEFSGYYTQQKRASEIVFGTQFSYNVTPDADPNIFILGAYHRWKDAIIPVVGFEWHKLLFMVSMDVTTSSLSPFNRSNGAFEFSLIFRGGYQGQGKDMSGFSCPRF